MAPYKSRLEREWQAMLHGMKCVMCMHLDMEQKTKTELHHVREGQGKGQRASTYMEIVLCWLHHQGPDGWHELGKMGFYQRFKLDEMDLLDMTLSALHAKGYLVIAPR